MAGACEYCGATPANYRITEEDGQRVALCAECRADVEYCARGGKPEPEEDSGLEDPEPAAPDCGIAGPHAPGAHPPAVDLTEPDEEELEPAEGRLVSEGTDAAWGFEDDPGVIGRGIAQRAASARARIFGRRYPAVAYALLGLLAAGSLYLTVHFAMRGRWLLALAM